MKRAAILCTVVTTIVLVTMTSCKSFKEGFEEGYYGEQDKETKPERKTSKGFAGTYPIEGEGDSYTGTLTIQKVKGVKEKAYTLEWLYDDADEKAYGNAIEVAGYLGFGDAGEGGVIGIMKKTERGGISSLWSPIEGDLVMAERSPGASRLYAATTDLSGTYEVKGASSDGSESYEETVTIEEMGVNWLVSKEFEDGLIVVGMGLAVDNVLVTAFDIGGSKIITLLEIRDDELDGKWVYSYFDFEEDKEYVVTGWEKWKQQ
ncbi:MAG: hypothetical protein JW724_08225 [Candidatus Altiarchaeota archaeon]|nr:hypothetical protein [Candidatus Altiarchaeota archaeon]